MKDSYVPRELLDADNIISALKVSVNLFGDNICQRFKDESKEPGEYKNKRTLKEYYELVRILGRGLIEEGLQPGSHFAILAENRPEWNLLDHAILMSRGITVGIYTNDSVEIIKYKFDDTKSWGIVVEDKKQLDKVLKTPASDVPSLKKIVLIDPAGVTVKDSRIVHYDDIMKKGKAAGPAVDKELDARAAAITADDVIRLVYTSGTSGKPKGVMLTHRNLKSNIVGGSAAVKITAADTLISYMPEAHSFQTFLSQSLLLIGGCLAYSFRKTLMSDLPQIRPTMFAGVQRVWAKIHSGLEAKISHGMPKFLSIVAPGMLANTIKEKAGIDNVRIFISGAGRLEPYTYEFFKKALGVTIHLGYGLSETSPVISVNSLTEERFGSSGKPIEGVSVRIVDEYRKDLPVGQTGEVAVKGDNVFVGYHNQMDKYHEVVDAEKWFYTGDRGYLDADGYVYVLGRGGHRVKFADGEHHDLEEIGARVIGYCKYISQIAVYGEYKEFPVAIVSLTDEEDDLRRMAAEIGVQYTSRDEFACNEKVVEVCKKDFEMACETLRKKKEVAPIEDVRKAIYIRPMSEDNNEKTPTQKTRLGMILKKYQDQIVELYEADNTFVVHKPKD